MIIPLIFLGCNNSFGSKHFLQNLFVAIYCALLALFAGLRSGTGTDYYNYLNIWNEIAPFDPSNFGMQLSYLESGFVLLLSFLKVFTSSSVAMYLVLGIIPMLFLYLALKDNRDINAILALMVYFSTFYISYAFNAMRQCIAMSIFLYSIKYYRQRNIKKVILLAIIATLFHVTGLLILLGYLLFVFGDKPGLIFTIGFIVAFILSSLHISSGLVYILFGTKGMKYFLSAEPISNFQVITRLMIAIICLIFNSIGKKDDFSNRLISVYIGGLFIYFAFKEYSMFATRINMFFRILEVLLFPYLVSRLKRPSNKILLLSVIIIITMYSFIIDISNPVNSYHLANML